MNQLGVSTSVAGVKKGEFGRKVKHQGERHQFDRRAL
jgi:hypothetical protein